MYDSKIAVLLVVHKNENQANRLIEHLSKDFDIYVHVDKRCSLKILKKNNVYVYKKYKVCWGSFNQIATTLYLLQKAYYNGYERYLLISGQDLPIKSNNQIELFFENNNKEYISFTKVSAQGGWPIMNRLTKYYPNQIYFLNKEKTFYNFLYRIQKKIFCRLNKMKTRKLEYDFYGGSNWINFTHACVSKIFEFLNKNRNYIKRYKWTSCADEIFFQTIEKH